MITTLFKREWKSGYKLLLIFLAVLSLYASMIIAMFDPKLGDSLTMMAESMPELFAAFGMLDVGSTMLEFIANYLYGFLLIVFPLVFIILLSSRLMARYIDRGSMAYLLATPHKRTSIALTQAFTMISFLFFLCAYITIFSIATCEVLFSGELNIPRYLALSVGWFGLLFFLGGICFCSACIFQDTKLALGVGGGLCIAFILLQMVSQAGDKFESVKYITPLTLFNPDGLVNGDQNAALLCGILYVLGGIFFGIGTWVFNKKDLNI